MTNERIIAETTKDKIKATLSILIGSPYAAGSKDFLDEYTNSLKGYIKSFDFSPIGTARLKVSMPENWRFGITLDYYVATAHDAFSEQVKYYTETIQRSLEEKFTVNTMPVLLIGEYTKENSPYRNYAGVGAGISFGNVLWAETVYSNYADDTRKSGVVVNEDVVAPCFKIYSGVELDFDESPDSRYLGSLIFEASYTYIFRNLEMFKNLRSQFSSPPPAWDGSYTLLPGYIGLHAGISFRFFLENK